MLDADHFESDDTLVPVSAEAEPFLTPVCRSDCNGNQYQTAAPLHLQETSCKKQLFLQRGEDFLSKKEAEYQSNHDVEMSITGTTAPEPQVQINV